MDLIYYLVPCGTPFVIVYQPLVEGIVLQMVTLCFDLFCMISWGNNSIVSFS